MAAEDSGGVVSCDVKGVEAAWVGFRPWLRGRSGGGWCKAEELMGTSTQGGDEARGTRLVLPWAMVFSPCGAQERMRLFKSS